MAFRPQHGDSEWQARSETGFCGQREKERSQMGKALEGQDWLRDSAFFMKGSEGP